MATSTDITDGTSWREQGGDVVEITRVLIVDNFTATPPNDTADGVIRDLLDDVSVPQPGATHPIEPELTVSKRHARALDIKTFRVEVLYVRPSSGSLPPPGNTLRITTSASSEEERLSHDPSTGVQLTVQQGADVQGIEIPILTPRETLELTGTFQTNNPRLDFVSPLMNKTNLGGFSFDTTADPRTWLITDVSATLTDRTKIPPEYEIRFSMMKRPLIDIGGGVLVGVDPVGTYIDPATGRPPDNLDPGGKIVLQAYEAINYASFFG